MEPDTKYTVSEITRLLKAVIEDAFPSIWIQGEISNFVKHSSGHFYFSLKDERSQIGAVMWRGRNMALNFSPQDGMKVLARGRITLFEKGGRYQLEVEEIQPLGVGELQMAFEKLKAKLAEEGLFSEENKKKIPSFPETIGIVTSPTGAAIRDLKSVIHRRFPGVRIILRPALVQGAGAAEDIALAIEECNEYGKIDVLVVGRGGGSLEDLWAFNEEIVARAIHQSHIPVVSAVGHEIDFTIADFVADLRAPTPSAAAEIVVQNAEDIWEAIKQRIRNLYNVINKKIEYLNERIDSLTASRAFHSPIEMLKQYNVQLDMLSDNLEKNYSTHLKSKLDYIEQLQKRLEALSPESVLRRGYSLVYAYDDDKIITNSKDVQIGDTIKLKFHVGEARGKVDQVN